MSKKSKTDSKIVEIKLRGHTTGIPVKTAAELSGLSERNLWTLHKQLTVLDVSEIMVFHYGGGRSAKADTGKQNDYFESTLKPLMEKAESGDIALPFLDASHFVMGCDFLGHIYGKTRRLVRTFLDASAIMCLGPWITFPKKSAQLPTALT